MASPIVSLPFTLPQGKLSIYGLGVNNLSGLRPNMPNIVFGTVNDVWAGGETYFYPGDWVLFDKSRADMVLYYGNDPYTIINANDAFKQILPP